MRGTPLDPNRVNATAAAFFRDCLLAYLRYPYRTLIFKGSRDFPNRSSTRAPAINVPFTMPPRFAFYKRQTFVVLFPLVKNTLVKTKPDTFNLIHYNSSIHSHFHPKSLQSLLKASDLGFSSHCSLYTSSELQLSSLSTLPIKSDSVKLSDLPLAPTPPWPHQHSSCVLARASP